MWFPGQKEDEKVIMLLKRHWVYLARLILITLMYTAMAVILWSLVYIFFPYLLATIAYPLLVLVTSLYFVFVWIHFFIDWINHYFDVWIITDQRIVDIEQISLFNRTSSETRLYQIQDASIEIKGIFATWFHYGDISLQTAGAKGKFEFKHIPHPEKIKQLVLNLHDRAVQKEEIEATEVYSIQKQKSKPTYR